MKKTIRDLVAENREAFKAATTPAELRQIARTVGILDGTDAENRARWPHFCKALKTVCSRDYYVMREVVTSQREETEAARLEASAGGHELHIIYVDAARAGHAPVKIGMIILDASEKEIARKTAFNSNCWAAGGKYDRDAEWIETQTHDQFAAECYGALKAVEVAKEMNLKRVEIRNDRISSFTASTNRDYSGAKYLWIAKKIASETGILVTFGHVAGTENIADGLSRSVAVYEVPTTPEQRAAAAAPKIVEATAPAPVVEKKDCLTAAPAAPVAPVVPFTGTTLAEWKAAGFPHPAPEFVVAAKTASGLGWRPFQATI